MDESTFRFRIYLREDAYDSTPSLNKTLKLLQSFSDSYSTCLHKAYKRFADTKNFPIEPVLRLDYARKGSLDSVSWIDFPASYAMIQPIIGKYSWDLLKNSFEFIKIVFSAYHKNEPQPILHVEDSPGSTNIITQGSNNNIFIGSDELDCVKKQNENMQELARQVGTMPRSSLAIALLGQNNIPSGSIVINSKTRNDYIAENQEEILDEEIKILCKIYKLNIKSKIGTLEPLEGTITERSLGFEIIAGEIDNYAEALKRNQCIVVAKPKILTTPFGEKKITYLYLTDISL